MNTYIAECNYEILLAEDIFERACDLYELNINESESPLDAIKKFIQSVIDAIKSLFSKAQDESIRTKATEVKEKIEILKKEYAKASPEQKRAIESKTFTWVDIEAETRALDEYHEFMRKEFMKFTHKYFPKGSKQVKKSYVIDKGIQNLQKTLEKRRDEIEKREFPITKQITFKELCEYGETIEDQYNEYMKRAEKIYTESYQGIMESIAMMEEFEKKEESKSIMRFKIIKKLTSHITKEDMRKIKRARSIFMKAISVAFVAINAVEFKDVIKGKKSPDEANGIGGLWAKTYINARDQEIARRMAYKKK